MNRSIDCRFFRRFGLEIEINTFDGVIKRADVDSREIPSGMDYVACIVNNASCDRVEISSWDYIHNNNYWVLKHDMSCGLEINTPVFKGWYDLKKLLQVIEALSKYKIIKADNSCSLHVHVNINYLDMNQLASVIAYYIKCEHVFFDLVPIYRKNNRYCQFIGMTDWFDTDFNMDPLELISRISQSKYGSINAFHFVRGGGMSFDFTDNDRRQTIEFRIAENTACLDPYYVKNWVRLLLHFVEMTKDLGVPSSYNGDPKTGLAWLDFEDVYKLLRFNESLSPGMQQVRQWFMERIEQYGYNNDSSGIWSNTGRSVNRKQFLETKYEKVYDEDRLYGKKWIL